MEEIDKSIWCPQCNAGWFNLKHCYDCGYDAPNQTFNEIYVQFRLGINPETSVRRTCELAAERVQQLTINELEECVNLAEAARIHNKEIILQIWIMQLKLEKLKRKI